MNTVFCRNTKNIIIMDSSYSFWGMGKARPVCRALIGGVRFSVSGWTKCPWVGAELVTAIYKAPYYKKTAAISPTIRRYMLTQAHVKR